MPTDSLQGSELIVQNLSIYVNKLGHKCSILILTRKNKKGWENLENQMNIKYFPFSSFWVGILFFLPYLLFINKKNFHYTFSSQTLINGILGFSKKINVFNKKTKVILRESNSIFQLLTGYKLKIYRLFYKIGYTGSSLVICQTDYMKEQLSLAMPVLSRKLNIYTISNPINLNNIANISKELNLNLRNENFIVAAGRLVPAKGFDLLIEAFSMIVDEYPDLSLIILGEGKDRVYLELKRNELGLKEKIILPGYVDNVYPYFKNAKTCILSSRIEGFPNVLLQMMSQNTKIVSTICAGDIEQIPGIHTCPVNNVDLLSQKIKESMVENNESKRKIFDDYLETRSQDAFYDNILIHLKKL